MSYCKINIGGKERGLKFNQMAILILRDKTDPEFPEATAAYALVYAGLKANCYVKNEEPDFTWEQVCEWVDGISDEELIKVNAAFMETEAYKKGQAYQESQKKSQKKSVGKSTKANV